MPRLKLMKALQYVILGSHIVIICRVISYIRYSMADEPITKAKSVESELASRLIVMRNKCDDHWSKIYLEQFSTPAFIWDESRKLIYCQSQKTGCTFWRRYFTFITLPEEMARYNISSPLDIDRKTVHDGPLWPKYGYSSWKYVKTQVDPSTFKFLFARDPYARLWSVYLDKYYLPSFWHRREIHQSLCLVNFTFNDFLTFALTSSDGHVSPVSKMCNPCAYQPHIIGKMETFSRDVRYILDQVNMGHVVTNMIFPMYRTAELKSIVTNTYQLYRECNMSTCLSDVDLVRRLWRVFQINGHLCEECFFPERSADFSENSLIRLLLHAVDTRPLSPAEASRQRKRYLLEAYKTVTRDNILGVQEKFQSDFELFGYDSTPPHQRMNKSYSNTSMLS